MNILTDEELNSIKDDHRDQLVGLDLLRSVEAVLMSKLAKQAGEPVATATRNVHGTLGMQWNNIVPHGTKLYTEAQLAVATGVRENCTLVPTHELKKMQKQLAEKEDQRQGWMEQCRRQGQNAQVEIDRLKKQLATSQQRTAEACAKVCDKIDEEYEGEDVLGTWCSEAIRNGEWREYL